MKPHISMARAPSANIIRRWELELKQIEAEAFVATAADDDNDILGSKRSRVDGK